MEPPSGRNQPPHNLRPQPTSVIGRERDLDTLTRSLLLADVRLLTLTGSGGTGKTRLALACAEGTLNHFPHGAYFVDLAPLPEPVLVMPTIADILQLRRRETRQAVWSAAQGVVPASRLYSQSRGW
jgi:hypothetical protein